MAYILVTGGAGFIGSHTCLLLLEAGHSLLILDNFSNSSPVALERVSELAGIRIGSEQLKIINGDIMDRDLLNSIFSESIRSGHPIEGVIHFAGLKAVSESVKNPLNYWNVNVTGSKNILMAMDAFNCRTLVFSSSATLYGYPESVPITEKAKVNPINPYGHTKAAVERLINDLFNSAPEKWRVACLRYFNPVGAHPSGLIGEDPNGIPNNLFPLVTQVAVGRRDILHIYGTDWPTHDGSGVRDYIHVMDLAEGHLAALSKLLKEDSKLLTLNLGSGNGASVLQVIEKFEEVSKKKIPYKVVDRRPGDAASTIADPSLAFDVLRWKTTRSLEDICRDGWLWQSTNPNGYRREA